MAFKAITVNTPAEDPAHILAEDDAAIYQGVFGVDGVLNIGSKLKATVMSNNSVRVADGVVVVNGHIGRNAYADYQDMTIENGTSGQKRNDLIVARFTTTGAGGIDTFVLAVKKGTAGSSASDPALTQQDIYAGGKQREVALYRVKLDGLSITGVDQLFKVIPAIPELQEEINKLNFKLKNLYPVGSIYMSVNNTDPGTLFGGTWERIQDKFLLAAGPSYTANSTGGASSVKLTLSNIPGHTHSIPSLRGTAASAGNHSHKSEVGSMFYGTKGNSTAEIGGLAEGSAFDDSSASGGVRRAVTQTSGAHTHSVSTNASATGSSGSGDAFSIMPPYVAIYIWKRTA